MIGQCDALAWLRLFGKDSRIIIEKKDGRMFIVFNRIQVNPDYNEAFEERFAERSGLVDGMDGFVSFQLLRPKTEGAPYVVMTTWESETHFKAWMDSPQYASQHGQNRRLPEEALLSRPKMETFETI